MIDHKKPEIAIIDNNTLTCIGLKKVLEEIIPIAIIRTFGSFQEFVDDTPDMYFHYFVSTQIFIENQTFFTQRNHKTIVLANEGPQFNFTNIHVLNINKKEEKLVKDILKLHQSAHHGPKEHHNDCRRSTKNYNNELSQREIEVLALIAKGCINKEIANILNISLTTVITHRKNITEKLGIKSVSALTIYAVMNGFIDANDI